MAPLATIFVLAALAGLIGLLWGLSELIGAFENETWRALKTTGGWLLLGINFLAAACIFLLTASLIPDANNWVSALLVGLAWPTVIRNASFKLAQPLPADDQTSETAVIRFEEAYRTVQKLARRMINGALTRQRLTLVDRAIEQDLSDLERLARKLLIISPLQSDQGMPADNFIDEIMKRSDVQNQIKKALLVAFVLRFFNRDTLDDFLKQQHKKDLQPKKTP